MAQNPLLDIIRSSGSSPRSEALAIANSTPLPEQGEVPYPQSDLVGALDSMDLTGDAPQDVASSEPPAEPAPTPKGNPLMDIIRGNAPTAPTLPKGNPLLDVIQANEAATQQAVAEATTPTENLPVLKSDLANALGVLDYRDPEEGQRRQQAAALGEILGLPEYEKVQLGAAPVNADGTVTIRRAQAVSPEANAAAAKQLANMQTMAAGEMLVEESPKEVGTLQGIANAAQNAFDSARQALMATDGLDENDASQIARIEYNKAARRVAPGYAAYQQAEGWDAVKAFAKNPFEVTANIITEGLAGSWPALAGGLATGGATALAVGAAGSVVPGVGNVIGAGGGFTAGMVGGTAAGSFATEYGSKILEELQTAGMNPKNPESIAKFFSNETLMAEAKDAAFKRGVPVAAFDALSAGIAGRVGSVFRAAAKTPVRLAVTEGVIQAGLGGAGEVAGSVAAGDPVNPKAVFGEVLGEVGPAAIEIAAGRQAAAPAEVPQNFTPISSPAPSAPTGQAPRTLGQVRAPEIPIDQTALDEAFGSTFAPPPAVSNDTFAPPAAVNPQVNPAPAPVNTTLPTDALPTETPGATYGREAEIYDAFANVRRTPLTDLSPAASASVASAPIAPEPTGSPEVISGEGTSIPTPFDFERASVYATSGGAKDLQQASNGISSTLAQIRDKRLASPYQSDFKAELFAQTEGITSNPSYAAAGIKSPDAGSSEVSEQDYDRLVEEGLQGNWQSLAGAIAMRGKASSIFPDLVDGKIPVWNIVGTQIAAPADLVATLLPLRSPYVESIKVAVLDSKDKVVSSEVVSVGTINEGILHARELTRSLARVRKNTKQNFNRIVISHNHPSGDPTPSGADLNITRRLDEAANAMGFEVVDHVITNGTKFYSFKLGFNGDNSVFTGDSSFNLTSKGIGPEAVDVSIPSKPAPIFEPTKAKWERVGRATLPYMDKQETSDELLSVLKQGDPNAGHILYLNTKLRLTAVERIPNVSSYENDPSKLVELKRRIMETAALDGAYGFIFHTPEKGGRSELLKQLTLFSRQAQLPMLDYAATDPNNPDLFYSAKSEGLLMEEGPQFLNEQPGTGPKPRKFGQSLQAAPGVAPEVKSRLTSLDYDPVSNAQTLANARARIDSAGSIDTAFTDLMGKPAIEGWQPTAEDYATGMELMAQLQNRNRHADAASIANMMATRATDQGRAIQALSMIGRLGPQGIELFAQSQLQAAATKPAKTDKQKADIQAKITEAGQLQGEVDKLRRDSTTAAIVGNKDLIKSSLPAGVDAVQVNIAIREAILGAPTPLAAQAATSSILTGQGLSDKGAARISGSIVRDFLKTTQDTRAKVLQDLLATADSDRRLDKSKLGSLIRLNREGKLTDASLHAGMAKMLGIPHWSAEHSAKVRRILAQHEKATDPRIKLVKAAEALDVVYRDFMPPGFLDKVDAIQTIAMLLNPKTVIRNVVGNTLMATADLTADTVSVPMDALVSLGTGERTRTGLSLGERMMGLGAGVGDIKAGYDFARSEGRGRMGSIAEGVDTLVRLGRLQSSGKYNASDISALSGPTFTAPVLRQLESTLGLVLSISDRGFYESAFRSSLDTRMKAAAANGNPMLAPDTDMVTAARMDAGRAIYQDPNVASRTLSGLRRVLNFNQRWGIGSLLMKFTQVPGSILTRAVEFSPLGFINTAYQSLAPMLSSSREFDQKAFTDSFSRALVGTTGLVATGYWLAHLGIISAGGDAKDEDKRNLNRAMGWGSYKLNTSALKRALMTGNFWTPQKQQRDDMVIGYDWAQPLSIGVAMGAYSRENQEAIKQDILQGKKQSLAATGLNWLAYAGGAATGAMNSLVEQPLLTGLNQFARDVGYDNIPGALLKTAADAPGTFIPTAARQWMQLTDNAARETRDSSPARQFINELKAQLPGQSQTLPQKYDITGQPIERWAKDSNTLFNVLFNPSMVSYIKGSPALTEMSKVYKYTAEAGAIPNQVKPEFTVEGVKVRLTSEEISAMQKDMGALSIAALEKFVLSDPRYDKATWDIKAKAMTRALEKAATAAKYRILLARPDLKDRAKQEYDAAIANRNSTQADMLAPTGP